MKRQDPLLQGHCSLGAPEHLAGIRVVPGSGGCSSALASTLHYEGKLLWQEEPGETYQELSHAYPLCCDFHQGKTGDFKEGLAR